MGFRTDPSRTLRVGSSVQTLLVFGSLLHELDSILDRGTVRREPVLPTRSLLRAKVLQPLFAPVRRLLRYEYASDAGLLDSAPLGLHQATPHSR